MSNKLLSERRGAFFSKLKIGQVIEGKVVELINDEFAIVEIEGHLIRCKMKNKVKENKIIKLKLEKLDWNSEVIVLKMV